MNRRKTECVKLLFGVTIRNGSLSSFATLTYFHRLLTISQMWLLIIFTLLFLSNLHALYHTPLVYMEGEGEQFTN